MSSYHSSFSYLGKNSSTDYKWLIVHFDADDGETDSFLSQDQVFTETYKGKHRLVYGTKWNSVATVKITVVKQNRQEFTVSECRKAYMELTGNPQTSWLDLYAGDKLQYSFLGTIQDVKPQKLDARTIGLNIYFESVSPWAYSSIQEYVYNLEQGFIIDEDGALVAKNSPMSISNDGVLLDGASSAFDMTDDGVVCVDDYIALQINNLTDDLYSNVSLDVEFTSENSDHLIIKNKTLYDLSNGSDGVTEIRGMSDGEIITLNSGQFISSNIYNKIFGKDFNFIWPVLLPGINEFVISGSGNGVVKFNYRYPIKIGDCAIDVYTGNDSCDCPDNTEYGLISWNDIINTPTTLHGYGIKDAYTSQEVDDKIENIEISGGAENVLINEADLDRMLQDVLGK